MPLGGAGWESEETGRVTGSGVAELGDMFDWSKTESVMLKVIIYWTMFLL